jgi:hypothetical protein
LIPHENLAPADNHSSRADYLVDFSAPPGFCCPPEIRARGAFYSWNFLATPVLPPGEFTCCRGHREFLARRKSPILDTFP